ncbi:hypothetical protein ACFWXH_29295 [Mesorhizobium sp. NPDC059054]|uniref:hypothetical protein n=1 Tax=Mesorhizobium sp. NPDC059054 TaxID=3346711 RepID=UPI0036796572
MDKTEIVSSRSKTILFLVVGLFVLLSGLVGRKELGDWAFWSIEVFAGACALVLFWLVIRPHRLLLNEDGFTLSGGLHWQPMKVLWRDVEEFVTKRGPNLTTWIGIRFRRDARRFRLAGWLRRDDVLPGVWELCDPEMVDYLNEWRLRAIAKRSE